MNTVDSFLVGVDFSNGMDVGVLVVGKRRNGKTDIVNMFQVIMNNSQICGKKLKRRSLILEIPFGRF